MKKLDKFQGHIVLYCKGHYREEGIDFITGIQRIWAVRCGLNVEHISNSFNEYIADDMYRVLKKVNPKKLEYLWEIIHKEISNDFLGKYKGLTAIERLVYIYKNELMMLQIKEKVNTYRRTLIHLPKPQRRLFKRIVQGKGEYKDYELVK